MLRRDGYDVTTAATAASATQICEAQSFDLLICDLELPDGRGDQVLNAAKLCSPRTRGIVVSGHDSPAKKAEATQRGFEDYFLKPIDYPALCSAIGRLLESTDAA